MLILLITWCILFLLCLLISEYFNIDEENLFIRFFLGLAALSLYLQCWAIFFPAKLALIPLIPFAISALFRSGLRRRFLNRIGGIRTGIGSTQGVILLIFLLIASLPSHINDDSAYYQQTIKWFSEYGYVAGLANINIHFGLSSGWHLMASAFYFDELPFARYYNFNGLVLWVLMISLLKEKPGYTVAILTVLYILGALFINAPSPDLVIICGTLYILLNLSDIKPVHLAFIIGFLITVKMTAAGLLLFIIPVLLRNKAQFLPSLLILAVFGILLIIRNSIITGHPFFPFIFFEVIGIHHVPVELIEAFKFNVIREVFDKYHFSILESYDFVNSTYERFLALFQVRSYKMIMNVLCLSAFILTPFILLLKKSRYSVAIALIMFINGILWFWQAPYYRFALGYVIFMFFILIEKLPQKLIGMKNIALVASTAMVLFANFKIDSVINLIACGKEQEFHVQNILYPVPFSDVNHQRSGIFNITDCSYCYDIPVPCYSEPVLMHYVHKLNYTPVPIDKNEIGKGFVMKYMDDASQSEKE